jgi:cobalamin synthase
MLLGPAALVILPLALAVGWLPARWARRRLEGVTGDVLGACEQAAETTVLVAAAAPLWGEWLGW